MTHKDVKTFLCKKVVIKNHNMSIAAAWFLTWKYLGAKKYMLLIELSFYYSITNFGMKIYNNFRNYLTGIISTNLKNKISCIEKQPTQLLPWQITKHIGNIQENKRYQTEKVHLEINDALEIWTVNYPFWGKCSYIHSRHSFLI